MNLSAGHDDEGDAKFVHASLERDCWRIGPPLTGGRRPARDTFLRGSVGVWGILGPDLWNCVGLDSTPCEWEGAQTVFGCSPENENVGGGSGIQIRKSEPRYDSVLILGGQSPPRSNM
jgi:hypothetical protein